MKTTASQCFTTKPCTIHTAQNLAFYTVPRRIFTINVSHFICLAICFIIPCNLYFYDTLIAMTLLFEKITP